MVLVFLWLTLNRFHILLWCFYCQLCRNKCRQVNFHASCQPFPPDICSRFNTSHITCHAYHPLCRTIMHPLGLTYGKWEMAKSPFPVGIYLLKVNNKNSRTRWEICSKLTIKTPERRHWRRLGCCIYKFVHYFVDLMY